MQNFENPFNGLERINDQNHLKEQTIAEKKDTEEDIFWSEREKKRSCRYEASEEEIDKEKKKLEIFSQAIGNAEYCICGGLAFELVQGKISYIHEDIDINVLTNQESEVIKNLENNGFNIIRLPSGEGHDLEAMNFAFDRNTGKASKEPAQGQWLSIGIFRYEMDAEKGTARHISKDGNTDLVFPLSYFQKDNHTINFEGKEYTVADLRMVAITKLFSNRPKDIMDMEGIIPMLSANLSVEETEEFRHDVIANIKIRNIIRIEDIENIAPLLGSILLAENREELCNVVKENIRENNVSQIRALYDRFLSSSDEINAEAAYEFFSGIFKESSKDMNTANKDYSEAAIWVLESIRKFRSSSGDSQKIKDELWQYIIEKYDCVLECHYKAVDKFFE